MNVLRTIHKWLGFFVGILLFIATFTATYLAANDLLTEWLKPSDKLVDELTIDQKAVAINEIFELYPKAKSLTFPTEETPYYEIFDSGSRLQLDGSYQVVGEPNPVAKSVWRFMFFMHRNFHLGSIGAQINAVASLITVGLTLVGLILLIPVWKNIKLKHFVPKNGKRSSLIRSHQLIGLFVAVPLIIAALTGAALTWRKQVQTLMIGEQPTVTEYPNRQKFIHLGEAIIAAQKIWPEQTVTSVLKRGGRKGKGSSLTIRFKTEDHAWLHGFDTITINYPKGRVIKSSKFKKLPVNEQVYSLIRSLHDGTRLPKAYTLWLFITMLMTSFALAITTFSFARNLLKK
ncbi:PepSY-associated TM helix domain-containing protein [Gayadomonas joobiniege]|uniref:PepSY-associated TM helix domain-containing protein n=1 Tax=Gayadomonas joobiniege TaxID=1234606 RepID=UPI000368ADAC|nr:PepSY-associated TM helix domain-containing protein [Gayadomonas joobiniege]